jgi:hypothetical protein
LILIFIIKNDAAYEKTQLPDLESAAQNCAVTSAFQIKNPNVLIKKLLSFKILIT